MSEQKQEQPPGKIEVAVGSTNPSKVGAVQMAAEQYLPNVTVLPSDIDSGVAAQPWTDDETLQGAEQRARTVIQSLGCDIGVGVESGVTDGPGGRLYAVSWAFAVDQHGRAGIGGSERFPLPADVAERLRAGNEELGAVIDEMLPNTAGRARLVGAVNVLTGSRRDRLDLLTVAVIHALADLIEPWRTG